MIGRENVIASAFRAFPDSIKFISFFNFIGNPSPINLFFMILFFTGTLVNFSLKKIISTIYKIFNVRKIPILGIGHRPKGASSCSTFLTFGNKPSKTFGMPSGHSQMAWIFSSFFIFKILEIFKKNSNGDNENDKNNVNDKKIPLYHNKSDEIKVTIKVIQIILLLLFAIFMSYSRVVIEKCHTSQQVIVGGIFGTIIGLVGCYIYEYYKL